MNSNKNWGLRIENAVYKELARFPKKDTERIMKTIKLLPLDPYIGDIQKIKGEENIWRRRVGNYRIFYEVKMLEKIVQVFWVERRTSSTY